jgi:hypothetical protein
VKSILSLLPAGQVLVWVQEQVLVWVQVMAPVLVPELAPVLVWRRQQPGCLPVLPPIVV